MALRKQSMKNRCIIELKMSALQTALCGPHGCGSVESEWVEWVEWVRVRTDKHIGVANHHTYHTYHTYHKIPTLLPYVW